MDEDESKGTASSSGNIEEILRERDRLTELLQKRFKKEVVVLFTDISGYTRYVESRGDISGRTLIQKHNDIVIPLIKKHEGLVIKTMGDAVMATFAAPLAAVKAAIDIQKSLAAYNGEVENADRIQIRIGINMGKALVDQTDVFGDVVNVASRIQSQAQKDQVLISASVYEKVRGSDDILCRWHGSAQVKGKSDLLDLYRVVWQEEDLSAGMQPQAKDRVRRPDPTHYTELGGPTELGSAGSPGPETAKFPYVQVRTPAVTPERPDRKAKAPARVLYVEASREEGMLKIGVYEQSAGEVSTVRHYEEITFAVETIENRCREIVETLNNANRKGRISRDVLLKLRDIGQIFRDELFTPTVKEKVSNSQADHLILNLDDHLVHVPWELLHDGQQFLCQRFSIGRLVKTRQAFLDSKSRALASPLKMLIIADPRGDLKGAYQEGVQIRDELDRHSQIINVSLRSDNITPDFIKEKVRNFDLIHFAGHADYNPQNPGESGWQLSKGTIRAHEIIKMAGTSAMPAFIFSNACQSARTETWKIKENFQDEIFGLANAFILTGVKHYVGTFWEILDEPSRRFALAFYGQLFSGHTVGEAVRQARMTLIKEYGEETIVWASYLLYGDPTFNYLDQINMSAGSSDEHGPSAAVIPESEVRTKEEVLDFDEQVQKKKSRKWLAWVGGIIGLGLLFVFLYLGLGRQDPAEYEVKILGYYQAGNLDEAFKEAKVLESKMPDLGLIYLVQGNIHFKRGNLQEAEDAYQKVQKAKKATDRQKAEAHIGLGRIAALGKNFDEASKYYQMATSLAPSSRLGYLNQALLLESQKNYKESLGLLIKAQELFPGDLEIEAIFNEARKRVSLLEDKEKRERIEGTVRELLERMKTPPQAIPTDGWTSTPLTVWIMDFQTLGYSLQEGEGRLVVSGLAENLLQNSHAQLIEREILDKLLDELKMGASALVERNSALNLGRILAAKLIVTGRLIYSDQMTQVSLRIIETETGRIASVLNESFAGAPPTSVMTGKVAWKLIGEVKKLYPLQGKIAEVRGPEGELNIGHKVGVRKGDFFKVVEEDLMLEVLSVQPDTSLVKIAKGNGPLQQDQRVTFVNQ